MTIGLYAKVYSPFPMGARELDEIELESITFDLQHIGGFWSASIPLSLSLLSSENWYEDGLGRVIDVIDNSGFLAFRGFVNEVNLRGAEINETRGPLMNVENRVIATFTPRDFSVYPPVDGSQTQTIPVEDTVSQDRYGIHDGIVSAGTCEEATAEKVRDLHIQRYALPQTTGPISITPGTSSEVVVTLGLLGVVHWLKRYIYDNTGNSMYYLSDKIKDVLAYDPNGFVSSVTNKIENNLYLVNELETKQRFAWDVLTELFSIGDDTTDTEVTFGVYENDIPVYKAAPTSIEYCYLIGGEQKVSKFREESGVGSVVMPWAVRPGKWITVPDFLIGRNIPSTSLNNDPRNKYIRQVRYSSPATVDLSGGDIGPLSQVLKKIQYAGGIL